MAWRAGDPRPRALDPGMAGLEGDGPRGRRPDGVRRPIGHGYGRGRFLPATSIWKPKLAFDPGGAPEARSYTPQKGLDDFAPYDRERFRRKTLRIAVVCEAGLLRRTEAAVGAFLHGLPDDTSVGPNPLVRQGPGS